MGQCRGGDLAGPDRTASGHGEARQAGLLLGAAGAAYTRCISRSQVLQLISMRTGSGIGLTSTSPPSKTRTGPTA